MNKRHLNFVCLVLFMCGLFSTVSAQNLSKATEQAIKKEVNAAFDKSIQDGEKLDIAEIKSNVCDTLKAGKVITPQYEIQWKH